MKYISFNKPDRLLLEQTKSRAWKELHLLVVPAAEAL